MDGMDVSISRVSPAMPIPSSPNIQSSPIAPPSPEGDKPDFDYLVSANLGKDLEPIEEEELVVTDLHHEEEPKGDGFPSGSYMDISINDSAGVDDGAVVKDIQTPR